MMLEETCGQLQMSKHVHTTKIGQEEAALLSEMEFTTQAFEDI